MRSLLATFDARSTGRVTALAAALGVLVAILLLPPAPASAALVACPQPPTGTVAYRVLHRGEDIGRVSVHVADGSRRATVLTEITLDVHWWILPVLTYRHRSESIWQDGAFQALSAHTVENGREYNLRVEPDGQALHVLANGKSRRADADVLISAVWCEAVLAGGRLLDPKGRSGEFSARYLGVESVPLGGRELPARRYAITFKDRAGALWYGPDGIASKAVFATRRGTPVVLLRE